MLSIKYIPALSQWLTHSYQTHWFLLMWRSVAVRGRRTAGFSSGSFGGSAISQTGPVNLSHPHRIHLIALSQLLSGVRNRVSPIKERELLNWGNIEKKKSIWACQMLLPSCWQFVFAYLSWEILTASRREKTLLLGFMEYLCFLLNSLKRPFHQNG